MAGLRDGSVPVNTDWLHDIAGKTYVVAPARFEAFAERAHAFSGDRGLIGSE